MANDEKMMHVIVQGRPKQVVVWVDRKVVRKCAGVPGFPGTGDVNRRVIAWQYGISFINFP